MPARSMASPSRGPLGNSSAGRIRLEKKPRIGQNRGSFGEVAEWSKARLC